MEDWEMSSYKDYVGLRDGTLCTKSIAYELLEIPSAGNEFIEQSKKVRV